MGITEQVKISMQLTGSICIKHPYKQFKYTHRKPHFKDNGVWVRVAGGDWKVIGYCKIDNILDTFEVR